MAAEVCAVHQNDKGHRFVNHDQLKRDTATIPRPRELEIKDTFLWAIGQRALTEMTKTVREQDLSALPLHKVYTLSRLHFILERNVQHSRANCFELKREANETTADW